MKVRLLLDTAAVSDDQPCVTLQQQHLEIPHGIDDSNGAIGFHSEFSKPPARPRM